MKKNKPNLKIDTNLQEEEEAFRINEYGSFMNLTSKSYSPVVQTTTTASPVTSSSQKRKKEDSDFLAPKKKQKQLSPKTMLKQVESLTGNLPLISPSLPDIIKQSPLFKKDYNNFDDINQTMGNDDDDEFKSIEDELESTQIQVKEEKKTKEELQLRAKEIKREADKEHKKGNIKSALHCYIRAGIKFLEAASISNEYYVYRDICTYFQQIGNVSLQSNNSNLNLGEKINDILMMIRE